MSLHEAASVGDVASIRALLQYGFSPNATDADGDTPLHLAAAGGHAQAIQCLLGAGASLGVRNQHGNTPLHIAALNGQSGAIRALREFGCEVDVKGTEAASTPLIGAASWGYGEAVGALLAAGASPNAVDRDGNTALHYIVMCWQHGRNDRAGIFEGYAEAARQLLVAGADPEARSAGGDTPLSLATAGGVGPLLELFQAGQQYQRQQQAQQQQQQQQQHAWDHPLQPQPQPQPQQQPQPQPRRIGAGALQRAAARGDVAGVRWQLQQGVGVNERHGESGDSALHCAAEAGQVAAIAALLEAGADVAITNAQGQTALHSAALNGEAPAIEALAAGGAPVDAKDAHGSTPLSCAASWGFPAAVKALLRAAADPRGADQDGCTALHVVVRCWQHGRNDRPGVFEGYLGCAQELLSAGADPEALNSLGETPVSMAVDSGLGELERLFGVRALHYAARVGDVAAIQRQLESGAVWVNEPDAGGTTALHCAAGYGHADAVRALCAAGGSTLARTKLGNTALHHAVLAGRAEAARALLASGLANPGAAGKQGKTPLILAAALGHLDCLRELLQAKADPNTADSYGLTPLHYVVLCWPQGPGRAAACRAAVAAARDLLAAGANPSLPDRSGEGAAALAARGGTPELQQVFAVHALHAAAEAGDVAGIYRALEGGAVKVDEPDAAGHTALSLAAARGQVQAIDALVAAGAATGLRDEQGDTALHRAAARGQVGAVLSLLRGGANTNIRNNANNTALHVAAGCGKAAVLAALANSGAVLDVPGANGATPLIMAAQGVHLAAVKTLLKAGASVAAFDREGNTALHHAALSLHHGDEAGCEDVAGPCASPGGRSTAVPVTASQEECVAMARELLLAGADAQAANRKGETPLALAGRERAKQLKKLLTEAMGATYIESVRQSMRPRGVPKFWATVFRNHPYLAVRITDKDLEVLNHLTDVEYEFGRDGGLTHRMLFVFTKNPHFSTPLLIKSYPTFEDASQIKGTAIAWHPGQDLTLPTPTPDARPPKPLQPGQSFFNWFKPPQVAGDWAQLDEEAQWAIQEDCRIAEVIGSILPRAQEWFTGEALRDFMQEGLEEEEGEGEEGPAAGLPGAEGGAAEGGGGGEAGPSRPRGLADWQGEALDQMGSEDVGSLLEHHDVGINDLAPMSELISSIQSKEGLEMAREALGRAKAAMQEQRFGSAHKEFTAAMELDQRGEVKFEAALGRSTAGLRMHRTKAAVLDAKMAREINPEDPRGPVAEGLAQMALKNYKFALACFQKALEMDEDYPDIYELVHTAQEAVQKRFKKRVELAKMFAGPVISMALSLLSL